tara:strand:+ start:2693 stop:3982 length:1290 start_codon:yes stop_codon:yes gene_type:complete
MKNIVVVGSQWGDEGKGKVVDWLSERADVIVRFQGGHNAGHTLVIDGKIYKLSLLPSGVVRNNKISVISSGVVIDPWRLFEEIDSLRKQEVHVDSSSLKIAENASLILPFHRDLDKAREDSSAEKIGTTRRGIGPAYEDKVGRRSIRVCDLENVDSLKQKVTKLLSHHNALRVGFGYPAINQDDILSMLIEIAPKLLPYSIPVWKFLDETRNKGLRILFEGAQGAMLDVDNGTYPFVTSSNTLAGYASVGTGVPPHSINFVLGITKAYTTRVGAGPFPTELNNEIGDYIGNKGNEFGTVTGRSRRCGWFDAVQVKQSIKIGGIRGIALTKLDVLDGLNEIKICVGYKINGQFIDYLPALTDSQFSVEPVYEILNGWKGSVKNVRVIENLPDGAIAYIRRIEQLIGIPIVMLTTSPEREDTILFKELFRN